jgi:hypothetical protein
MAKFFITLRIFPANRRASFSSVQLEMDEGEACLKDIFKYTTQVTLSTHKFARGIVFLAEDAPLFRGETINCIPILPI